MGHGLKALGQKVGPSKPTTPNRVALPIPALEVNNGVSAPPAGWGLDHALRAWGSYFTNTYLPRGKTTFLFLSAVTLNLNLTLVCGDYYSAA